MTKDEAQIELIELLVARSKLAKGSTVLDVGCGIGGTSRYLAREHGCKVQGVTISGTQVEIAERLTAQEAGLTMNCKSAPGDAMRLANGEVGFVELDAERMLAYFEAQSASFDCAWISEAASHFPDKALVFRNVATLLKPGGKLVIADWFKAEDLTQAQHDADIKPIEGSYRDAINLAELTHVPQMGCSFHHYVPCLSTYHWRLKEVYKSLPSQWISARKFQRRGRYFPPLCV